LGQRDKYKIYERVATIEAKVVALEKDVDAQSSIGSAGSIHLAEVSVLIKELRKDMDSQAAQAIWVRRGVIGGVLTLIFELLSRITDTQP